MRVKKSCILNRATILCYNADAKIIEFHSQSHCGIHATYNITELGIRYTKSSYIVYRIHRRLVNPFVGGGANY